MSIVLNVGYGSSLTALYIGLVKLPISLCRFKCHIEELTIYVDLLIENNHDLLMEKV